MEWICSSLFIDCDGGSDKITLIFTKSVLNLHTVCVSPFRMLQHSRKSARKPKKRLNESTTYAQLYLRTRERKYLHTCKWKFRQTEFYFYNHMSWNWRTLNLVFVCELACLFRFQSLPSLSRFIACVGFYRECEHNVH